MPKLFGVAFSELKKFDGKMKDNTSKNYLSKAFSKGMTYERLAEVDPDGEVKSWFDKIAEAIA